MKGQSSYPGCHRVSRSRCERLRWQSLCGSFLVHTARRPHVFEAPLGRARRSAKGSAKKNTQKNKWGYGKTQVVRKVGRSKERKSSEGHVTPGVASSNASSTSHLVFTCKIRTSIRSRRSSHLSTPHYLLVRFFASLPPSRFVSSLPAASHCAARSARHQQGWFRSGASCYLQGGMVICWVVIGRKGFRPNFYDRAVVVWCVVRNRWNAQGVVVGDLC